jgi:hypothetical protein
MEPNTGKTLMRTCFRVQDNDSKHIAKATLELLQNKNVEVLECPSQRSDLNLIESLRHTLIYLIKSNPILFVTCAELNWCRPYSEMLTLQALNQQCSSRNKVKKKMTK